MGIFDALKKAAADAFGTTVSEAAQSVASGASNAIHNARTTAAQTSATSGESVTFTFEKLPQSLDEMKTLDAASLDTPFKAAALTVCALAVWGENRETGKALINFLKGPQPLSPMEEQFIRDRFMDGKKYVPLSYFEGATSENNYTPSEPYKLTVFANPYSYREANYAVLHIKSGGADSPRQIKLRRKGEQWFLWEQFILSDIRTPKAADPWA